MVAAGAPARLAPPESAFSWVTTCERRIHRNNHCSAGTWAATSTKMMIWTRHLVILQEEDAV
jgi:hypothetical protein